MTALADTALTPFGGPREHLLAELDRLELLLRRRAIVMRDAGLVTDSEFRGLYVADEHIDRLPLDASGRLEPPAAAALAALAADAAERIARRAALGAEPPLPLERLARVAGLTVLEVDVLLLAAGAELDLRWERLFAYVQDDVTRRRPTLQLVLELLCASTADRLRGRSLLAGGMLMRAGLVRLIDETGTAPLPAHMLAAEERTVSYLLGEDACDPALEGRAEALPAGAPPRHPELRAAAGALRAGVPVVLHGRTGCGGRAAAASIAGGRTLAFDVRGVEPPGIDLMVALVREALLADAVAYVDGADELPSAVLEALVRRFRSVGRPLIMRARGPVPAVVAGPRFAVHLPAPSQAARRRRWREAAMRLGVALDPGALDELAAKLLLEEPQTAAVLADGARRTGAGGGGDPVCVADVEAAARAAADGALGPLVERTAPRWRLEDVVLPARQHAMLRAITARVRHRATVHNAWGFRAAGPGDGLSVLLHGASGTGKTMAAEALAAELGLELYRIDLAMLVSKYIGETEKNLRQVFAAAATVNGILLFDEADALFGRRSEVKDAHDRYANTETAYLLGEFERYPGLTVLTTNLVANLDDAFTRRIDLSIEFPMPGPAERARLWRAALPATAPLVDDVDLRSVAERLEVTGAVIRSACLAAAFAAAARGDAIGRADLVSAVASELEKLGRPATRGEFGELFGFVQTGAGP